MARPGKRRFQKSLIAYTNRATVRGEDSIMDRQSVPQVDPKRFAFPIPRGFSALHLERTCRVLR